MKTHILSVVAISVATLTSYAQDKETAYQALIDNAPEACTPDAPPAIKYVTRDNKFVVGFNAMIKTTASYDVGHVLDNPDNFVSLDIPIATDPGNGANFLFSAQQTSFTLNAVALPGTANQVGAYVTINLLGNAYTPAVEYALLTYRGFAAGYGYTLFSDTKATIPTIDYMGPNGYTGVGNAGLQYRKKFDCGIMLGAALELPITSVTENDETAWVNQRVPDIPVAIAYNWNEGSDWVRFSAVLRNMQYRNVLTEHNHDNVGWGVQLSGSMGLLPGLRMMYQGTYGNGIVSYFQDYTGHGYDMAPDPTSPGKLKNVKAWGGYIGLQYNFSDNVYMCAGYSHVRDYIDRFQGGETAWGDMSRYTQYAVGNLFWDINDYLSWGVEYIWGRRVNFDGAQAHNSRIQTMLQFSF